MIRFHVAAANAQLRQAYWAFAAALALNRTLVLPRVGIPTPSVALLAKCVCVSQVWVMVSVLHT